MAREKTYRSRQLASTHYQSEHHAYDPVICIHAGGPPDVSRARSADWSFEVVVERDMGVLIVVRHVAAPDVLQSSYSGLARRRSRQRHPMSSLPDSRPLEYWRQKLVELLRCCEAWSEMLEGR